MNSLNVDGIKNKHDKNLKSLEHADEDIHVYTTLLGQRGAAASTQLFNKN